MKLNIPSKGNKKLEKLIKKIESDVELNTFWKCSNVVAMDRLSFSDHGPTHIKIVANISLKMLRLLVDSGVQPSAVAHYGLKAEDSEVIVLLACMLHDIGHVVHRADHEMYSVPIAMKFLDKLLDGVYKEEKKTIITAEVLHAIVGHHKHVKPLTIEAGIVRISDALDMKAGRARIPFNTGSINIHSVSAMAIKDLKILKGSNEKPLLIKITMSNSAGIFQVDDLLGKKINNSGLEKYITVQVEVLGEKEAKIVENFEL